jgi:hypothetical protein
MWINCARLLPFALANDEAFVSEVHVTQSQVYAFLPS